ncbi:hypothetical protein PBI_LUCKY3_49 [Microbacterium phage Lucky3]|uniref:Uncharacterized protein n=2 Tax=Kojivirus golden TaxID=2560590 RepID=A0A2P1CFT4_9CAUD|nr:hypothetical protein FDJ42_gp49 [Microbacterium phage Golden]AVJ49796.1 hypothetical protein PBI_GOLDEN_49 [Microbacterium phage Golden]AVJ50106.1 hypothetical protein PBI_LUCKY3_49 [Microbacterium phage Lucky3]WNM68022.1 hypothetical protein SEA_SIRVICTOR_50 [Microbacterium phage SirVictor]WNM74393.1 hypothetical protein SEA_GUETZIE_50 [Microbacterium phage Guetzie]
MDIKQLLTSAITDQDSRVIHRLLNDAVELKAVTAQVATKLGHLADVMYTGTFAVRQAAAASALALVK